MNLTEWYPAKTKPVRKGVYQIAPFNFGADLGVRYSKWDGARWSYFAESIQSWRNCYRNGPFHSNSFPWRGLAEKP